MKARTDLDWERWGKQDPYFGVLTDPKYRQSNIKNTKADFFESGKQHIIDAIEGIEQHFGPIPRASALDFGCGVGRLLVRLSTEFNRIRGLDVSKSMLEEASKSLAEVKIDNVELLESDDTLSVLGNIKFDFIHTYQVLQHIPPERGYRIIHNLLDHLSTGGAFFIHVCCRRNLPLAKRLIYLIKIKIPYTYILFNILRNRKAFEPVMEMNEYDIGRLLGIFRQAGFQKIMTKLENHGNFLTASFYSRNAN
jgi:2-polyprenyl-3-methyl-5-hydroxy-6-metoxy-1,4-benzoquinol methylase